MRYKSITAYVTETQYEALRAASYERHRKMADIIRESLDEWLTSQGLLRPDQERATVLVVDDEESVRDVPYTGP